MDVGERVSSVVGGRFIHRAQSRRESFEAEAIDSSNARADPAVFCPLALLSLPHHRRPFLPSR